MVSSHLDRPTPLERIRALEELGSRRLTGTPTERAAQEALGAELQRLGFALEWHAFRFPQSKYEALVLHFGLAVLATVFGVLWPWLGFSLHGLVAASYCTESRQHGLLLSRLLTWRTSQNLIASLPAKTARRCRLVLMAHADAAFTGLVFSPRVVRLAARQLPPGLRWLRKSLRVVLATLATLAVLEVFAAANIWVAPWWLMAALTVPAFVTFALAVDVVLRNQVVPGAADNLSGCSACVELAHRLAGTLPEDVELAIVITGAEEAGTGGAFRLMQHLSRTNVWSRADTLILGLDTVSNGELRYLEEGELWPIPVPPVLESAIQTVNDERRPEMQVTKYVIPVGASDALPFLVHGWPAVSLTCIDPSIGAPRHYHSPTDTWSNIGVAQLNLGIDFAERLTRRLAQTNTPLV